MLLEGPKVVTVVVTTLIGPLVNDTSPFTELNSSISVVTVTQTLSLVTTKLIRETVTTTVEGSCDRFYGALAFFSILVLILLYKYYKKSKSCKGTSEPQFY